jgi:hypothetical protein
MVSFKFCCNYEGFKPRIALPPENSWYTLDRRMGWRKSKLNFSTIHPVDWSLYLPSYINRGTPGMNQGSYDQEGTAMP